MREHNGCRFRDEGVCCCEDNPHAPFKCPYIDPNVPQDTSSYFPCPTWEPTIAYCLKCVHCQPYKALLGVSDWHCKKHDRDMQSMNLGVNFTCDDYKEKKVKE